MTWPNESLQVIPVHRHGVESEEFQLSRARVGSPTTDCLKDKRARPSSLRELTVADTSRKTRIKEAITDKIISAGCEKFKSAEKL